jgi:malate dehydrogenase (quinone)
VVLVGGGILSAILGVLLRRAQPDWSILVLERLHGLGLESSAAWNNAGTGHAGLCETPLGADGSIDLGGAPSAPLRGVARSPAGRRDGLDRRPGCHGSVAAADVRPSSPRRARRRLPHRGGTDVDCGVLTRRLFTALADDGVEVRLGHEVRSLSRDDRTWRLGVRVCMKHTISAFAVGSCSSARAEERFPCSRAPACRRRGGMAASLLAGDSSAPPTPR